MRRTIGGLAAIGLSLLALGVWMAAGSVAQQSADGGPNRQHPEGEKAQDVRGTAAGQEHEHEPEHGVRATAVGTIEPEDLPAPVVDTHRLMELFNEPLYQALKGALKEEPAEDEAWGAIGDNAYRTAEVMNLVVIQSPDDERAVEWRGYPAVIRRSALNLAAAAENQDIEAARAAFAQVIHSCNACHDAFAPGHAPTLEP